MPTEAELDTAKENLRNTFFAIAFDPDNREAAEQADAALRELDRMLELAEPAGGAGVSAGQGGEATLRRTLSTPKIVVLVIAAAAPMAAMVGTVPLAFAVGNGPGVPGMFAVAGIVLLCFSVGYAAMSRRIVNAGGFYTYLSCGLGKPVAVGGGLVAVLSYNAVCVGLIGAFGYFLHLGLAQSGIHIPWQVFAVLVLAATAMLGYRSVDISARVLRVLMTAEIAVLLVLAVFVFAHRGAATLPSTSFTPHTVLHGTVGVTMMFAFSAFIGFESAALYGEEAHNPERSVPLATYTSVLVITVFYAFVSWVAVGAVGPMRLQNFARHQLGNMFFTISNVFASPVLTFVMQVLLVTSLFAAILALHNATNRYMYVLGRERVLPSWLGQVHARHFSPHRASLVQTSINVVIIGVFAVAGLNPYTTLATSMIGLGTLGIVSLQAATSVAVIGFFRNRSDRHWWRTFLAPGLGAAGLITGVVLLVRNFGVLTGTSDVVVSALPLLLPIAVVSGVSYALWLRRSHPERYAMLAATAVREPADATPAPVGVTVSATATPQGVSD